MSIVLPASLATAAACAVLSIWLAIRISVVRRSERVWVGDGGSPRLIARMRAQANFVEYAPFALVLLALLELAKGPSPFAWAYGATFVVARILHPLGMDGWRPGRVAGTALTLSILALLAGECAWTAWQTRGAGEGIAIEQMPAA